MTYMISVAIIVVVPGPNVMLVVNDSINVGFKKGFLTILGIKAGTLLLVGLSMIGLTALLTWFSWLFLAVKWVGVCYLLYLGIMQIRSSGKPAGPVDLPQAGNRKLFMRGFLVSATNPKGLLFAGAFFPQFLNPEAPLIPQMVILCVAFVVVAFLVETVYAYAGNLAAGLFKSDRFRKVSQRISGAVLIAFGIALCFAEEK
ncbi:MAG: LysE family translocator [Desulfarculaceae bacterium]|nr:LysE family translocator [Desulfarculaceae bacterium]MCF8073760.1 LysE family translocator [Desulfarculaceae bacterium]MCF8102001.1 LysE family translocator [Desulfarculaceae bacterium]MCF8115971.1 LysE family translocator [Desulfarculaceae bacterium]